MSASVMGQYSPQSPREMSSETTSPIFPDRPIRPLPKRRLRERLSLEVAESIKYPPAPPTTTPLFYYPYSLNGHGEEGRSRERSYPLDRQRADEIEHNYIPRRNIPEVDSDEDYHELAYRSRYSRHSPDTSGRSYRYVQKLENSKATNPEPPASITSSADGYDSFENTNNKKKRKIPTPGDAGLNGIHLSNDLATLGISPAGEDAHDDAVQGSGQHYGSAGSATFSSTQGISGPGRGRYGRVRNGRSPLRSLSDAANNWTIGRAPKQRLPQWPANGTTGIISTAIANAEKRPLTPPRGQENVSLLERQASKNSSPASTQFTFTCESQVPGTIAWPGANPTAVNMHQVSVGRGLGSQSAHAGSNGSGIATGQSRQSLPPSQLPTHPSKQNARPTAPTKKSRRRTGKEYLIAARQRREQQEYQNYHHPPAPEDEWICEFCEYERIFGSPPEALIKQYEVKDRRVRKQEAERRRLLEKAKMKGRKGKKSKVATKNVAPAHDRQPQQHVQQPSALNPSQSHSQGTQSEEYFEDEYEDDFAHDEPLPSPNVPSVSRSYEGDSGGPKKRLAVEDTTDS